MGVGAICSRVLQVESRNLRPPSLRRGLRVDCSNTFFPLRRTNFRAPFLSPSYFPPFLPSSHFAFFTRHASPLKIFCSERTNERPNDDDAFSAAAVATAALLSLHTSLGRPREKVSEKGKTAVNYWRSSEHLPSQVGKVNIFFCCYFLRCGYPFTTQILS